MKNKSAFSLVELSIVLLIIGIVVVGVSSGSSLIKSATLSGMRSANIVSPVPRIKNLNFWVETVSKESFDVASPAENTDLDNWNDINVVSTSPINFSASGTDRGVYKTDAKAIPYVEFDGDLGEASTVLGSKITSGNEITIFVVGKHDAGVTGSFFNWGAAANTIQLSAGSDGMTGTYGSANVSATSLGHIGTWNIFSFTKTSADIGVLKLNGTQVQSAALVTAPDNSLSQTLSLGLALNGSIREVISYSRALTDEETDLVESYLSQKWDIPVS